MSTSTDAIICFGVEFEDDDIEDWNEDEWLSEKYDTKLLSVVRHCHDDEPMYIVSVRGTYVKAWRGDPRAFDVQEMSKHITQEALDELRKISDKEPKWFLCSYWG